MIPPAGIWEMYRGSPYAVEKQARLFWPVNPRVAQRLDEKSTILYLGIPPLSYTHYDAEPGQRDYTDLCPAVITGGAYKWRLVQAVPGDLVLIYQHYEFPTQLLFRLASSKLLVELEGVQPKVSVSRSLRGVPRSLCGVPRSQYEDLIVVVKYALSGEVAGYVRCESASTCARVLEDIRHLMMHLNKATRLTPICLPSIDPDGRLNKCRRIGTLLVCRQATAAEMKRWFPFEEGPRQATLPEIFAAGLKRNVRQAPPEVRPEQCLFKKRKLQRRVTV
jgi:hypothetical protein